MVISVPGILFAPDVLGAFFGIYVVEFAYVWLANAGMLLVQASCCPNHMASPDD